MRTGIATRSEFVIGVDYFYMLATYLLESHYVYVGGMRS
jgi:hypothetical protein